MRLEGIGRRRDPADGHHQSVDLVVVDDVAGVQPAPTIAAICASSCKREQDGACVEGVALAAYTVIAARGG